MPARMISGPLAAHRGGSAGNLFSAETYHRSSPAYILRRPKNRDWNAFSYQHIKTIS
jgi:hypothetical protein